MRILAAAILVLLMTTSTPAQSTRPVVQSSADVRGISWSDPRDNYNPAQIVPAGLTLQDTPQRAAEVAKAAALRIRSIGGNVIRLGINPPTIADEKWWPVYTAAVRSIAANGVGVILCAWEQSPAVDQHGRGGHNGRFGAGDVQSYARMWQKVADTFRDEPNVIGYELLNEPFGYRGQVDEYVRDMRTLIAAIGDDRKRVLVAGVGYSDDVQAIRDRFPEPHVWFAYHIYPNWFGAEAGDTVFTREQYAAGLAKVLEGVEHRTVITEFGCWGAPDIDFAQPPEAQKSLGGKRHVAFLLAVADVCERQKVGSIYWFGDARESRARPSYDLFADDGKPYDQAKVNIIRRGWRVPAASRPDEPRAK